MVLTHVVGPQPGSSRAFVLADHCCSAVASGCRPDLRFGFSFTSVGMSHTKRESRYYCLSLGAMGQQVLIHKMEVFRWIWYNHPSPLNGFQYSRIWKDQPACFAWKGMRLSVSRWSVKSVLFSFFWTNVALYLKFSKYSSKYFTTMVAISSIHICEPIPSGDISSRISIKPKKRAWAGFLISEARFRLASKVYCSSLGQIKWIIRSPCSAHHGCRQPAFLVSCRTVPWAFCPQPAPQVEALMPKTLDPEPSPSLREKFYVPDLKLIQVCFLSLPKNIFCAVASAQPLCFRV